MPSVHCTLPYQILSSRMDIDGGWDLTVLTPFGPLEITPQSGQSFHGHGNARQHANGSIHPTPAGEDLQEKSLDIQAGTTAIPVRVGGPAGEAAEKWPPSFQAILIQMVESILKAWDGTKWCPLPFHITLARNQSQARHYSENPPAMLPESAEI